MSALEIASPTWLLMKSCQDIVAKSQSPDPYAKLRMAGLLRHLLVGTHALVERALVEGDEAPTFWFREPPADEAWTTAEGFDASRRVSARGTVRRTPKDEFLTSRLAHFGDWYTVGQLVCAVDHFYGGAPSTGLEGVSRESMRALDVAVKNQPTRVMVALQEAGGVTLRALLPIAERHQPASERPRPIVPVAPAGSGCPFAGKIALDLD